MAKPRQKSRSGCRTCKLRKVKCDETRPICKRCTLADRTCEGYGIWGGGHVRVVKSRQFPESELTGKPRCLQFLPLQADERRCFEWYMLRSTTKLDGIFFSPKLANLMLQASVSEPAVLHALLSLGSCHMEEVFQCKDGKQSMVTFKQYNKAIGFLTPKIDGAHTNALRASLMVCTLFTLMEPLRGCYVAGLLHLEYGLKLLSCLKGVIMSSEFDFWMVTTLSRHIVQAKLFGQLQHVSCRDLIELGNESDTPLFRSVHHAGRRLDVVAMSMFELKDGHIEDDKLVACRQQLDVDIQLWEDTYLATVRPDMQVMEAFSYDLLRCYHRVIRVMAVAGQDPENEMLYDSCTSDFIAIIEFCIAAYLFTNVAPDSPKGRSHRDVEDCSPNSITEIGWIAPLYFTAIKCRFPRLRRQALSLLKLLPHREGCFETNLCCEIAHEVIAIEEIGRYCSITFEDFMLSDPVSNATQPSLGLTDKHRLRRLALKLPEDKTGTLKLEGVRGTDAISRKFNLQTETWHSPVQNWRL